MTQPRYQEVVSADIPTVHHNGVIARIVAGEYNEIRGPVKEIAADPLYMDVTIEPEADFDVPVPVGHSAVAYVFEGAGLFGVHDNGDGDFVEAIQLVVFTDGDSLRVQTSPGAHTRFMLMAGAPFKEPIVPYGPFVMNTPEEIQQAFVDLRNGTFV
jgi:redox-sensitive bicupin YhaK (pirin superfamily)